MLEINPDFSAQRLQFCIVLIAVVHLLFIFGISWQRNHFSETTKRTVEVILATEPSHLAQPQAQLIAAKAQEANGVEQHDASTQPQSIWQPIVQYGENQKNEQVLTSFHADEKAVQTSLENNTDNLVISESQQMINQRMANLRTELAQQQQQYSEQLQKRTVTAAANAAIDAEYLHEWRMQVESIGNLHYPEQARNQQLYGDVLLLVAINTDGSLRDVQIRQSSGNKILDEAALQIVRLAAPFPPLPAEMRKNTMVLEIIRTWQFGKDNRWHVI